MGCLVINKVFLAGHISKNGVTVTYAQSGTPCAQFTLILTEQGSDHKTHSTYVDCEVWGKHAEEASDLEPGQLALFEGKLAKRKKGDQWDMVVSGYDVTVLAPVQATWTGNPN
jgi:single-stranded DNA-binding protein